MATLPPLLLLRVAATLPLPGLGLLALPDGPTPYLAACELHAVLLLEAQLPDGTRQLGAATVEEIARPETTVRGLLLDLNTTAALPPGTIIWLRDLLSGR